MCHSLHKLLEWLPIALLYDSNLLTSLKWHSEIYPLFHDSSIPRLSPTCILTSRLPNIFMPLYHRLALIFQALLTSKIRPLSTKDTCFSRNIIRLSNTRSLLVAEASQFVLFPLFRWCTVHEVRCFFPEIKHKKELRILCSGSEVTCWYP